MERRESRKKQKNIILLSVLLVLLAVGAVFLPPLLGAGGNGGGEAAGPGTVAEQEQEQGSEPAESPVALRIICVGDVMAHQSQIQAQYDAATGTYDFSNNFQYAEKYIKAADLAICNVETTFAGGTPTGYPSFNAPDALARDLAAAGFNFAVTANNHCLDKGKAGLERTLQVLREQGFETAGTCLEGEKNYTVTEVKGIKIGVVAYTYETQPVNGRRTINGSYIPETALPLVNSFAYEYLDQDLQEVKSNIDAARAEGAQLIVLYFHWGEEYQNSANTWQKQIAGQLAEMGPDVIFGSHPHVIQEAETLTNSQGKKIPVFYSMGNFISNQRAETLDNRYTENAIIAGVDLEILESTGEVTSVTWNVQPLWLDRYSSGGKLTYTLIPLDGDMENNPALQASGHLARARQSLADAVALYWESRIAY
ncbi:MAG: CapA family protein [Bacillota bacterium]|nr:CapA family protein [Bacillota bacterium]